MSPVIAGLILIVAGILVMLGSAMNWWIITRPGKLINRLLGDSTARVIYFGIGIFTFVKGIELAIGVHWLPF
jgi:hypothetical protein